jgi:hypothetical protein
MSRPAGIEPLTGVIVPSAARAGWRPPTWVALAWPRRRTDRWPHPRDRESDEDTEDPDRDEQTANFRRVGQPQGRIDQR